jgi:uncharacterized MAPEG superfamily protein
MTIAELCMLGMLLVTIGAIAPAKVLGRHEYDNALPRDPGFFRTGFRQRSQWAHQNSYEALPLFFAAVILAEMRAMPQATIDTLAVAFLLARTAYVAAYWADRPTLRSAVWALALACNLGIFLLPAWGG